MPIWSVLTLISTVLGFENHGSKTWIAAFAEGPDSVACCARGVALIEEKRMEAEVLLILKPGVGCGSKLRISK